MQTQTEAVLDQRMLIPYHKSMKWIDKELVLKQKQLSPLAPPGVLTAYTMDGGNVLLPKAWALQNKHKLGIRTIQDHQVTGEQVDCPVVVQQLRPHQQDALTSVCTQLTSSPYGGGAMLVFPCGYGKSVTALAVAAQLKLKSMVVTHTAVLAAQWKDTIMQYCPAAKIGQIVQDKYEVEDCTHVIASLQSLAKRQYPLQSSGIALMVIDECHHLSALQMSEAINNAGCRYRLGLSATPVRADGLSPFLEMAIGPIAYEISRPPSDELKVYMINLDHGPIETMVVRGPKATANIAGMINLLVKDSDRARARQKVCLDWIRLAIAKDRKILVVGDRIELLKQLEEQVRTTTTTGFLIGSAKPAEREAAKDAQVIFGSYGIVSEGLDLTELDTLLFQTPRSGVNCITQCIGRLLRHGGRFPLVIDIVDDQDTFRGMSKKRLKLYNKSGAKVSVFDEHKQLIA
jgi:superfamily II DNA or RNA helicase